MWRGTTAEDKPPLEDGEIDPRSSEVGERAENDIVWPAAERNDRVGEPNGDAESTGVRQWPQAAECGLWPFYACGRAAKDEVKNVRYEHNDSKAEKPKGRNGDGQDERENEHFAYVKSELLKVLKRTNSKTGAMSATRSARR